MLLLTMNNLIIYYNNNFQRDENQLINVKPVTFYQLLVTVSTDWC